MARTKPSSFKSLNNAEFRLRGPETPEMIARATELVRSELHEYSVEELVNYELSALWKNHI